MSGRTLDLQSCTLAGLLLFTTHTTTAHSNDAISGYMASVDNAPSTAPKNITPQSPTPRLAAPSANPQPSASKVLMCVQRDLVDQHAWDHPAPGSRMSAFRRMAIPFIQSFGRPGWEYWILDVHYNRFDPRQPTSAGTMVVQLPPTSGRFDPANPSCPAKYAGYWINIAH